MQKEELIRQLQLLPEGIDVCIFDYNRNLREDDGEEGSSAGIYEDIAVSMFYEKDVAKSSKPFAALVFNDGSLEEEDPGKTAAAPEG